MFKNILSRVLVTIDGVWVGELGLLATYTHQSELHVITALSLINILQFTVTHALGFSVFTSRILATDLNTLIIIRKVISLPIKVAARSKA
jgi:hypothetical protein